jgi:Rps23 Pro-64 3,4-dihydroxylase Tpa1-like proline 4-hydroxylase
MPQQPLQADRESARVELSLQHGLPAAELGQALRREGRVRIPEFLASGAMQLLESLWYREDWIHLISAADGVIELDRAAKAELGNGAWEEIEATASRRAQTGFQYRYEALRVPQDAEGTGDGEILDLFDQFMASEPMQRFLSAVLDAALPLKFTDGQATAYDRGDFLTGHDDNVPGRNRLAAFVLGLTPVWRPEWGGLLLFHEEGCASATALVPQFNTLDLFLVPQIHSVSLVAPSAAHRRLAITGWISTAAS